MKTVTKPLMLDSTGKEILDALRNLGLPSDSQISRYVEEWLDSNKNQIRDAYNKDLLEVSSEIVPVDSLDKQELKGKIEINDFGYRIHFQLYLFMSEENLKQVLVNFRDSSDNLVSEEHPGFVTREMLDDLDVEVNLGDGFVFDEETRTWSLSINKPFKIINNKLVLELGEGLILDEENRISVNPNQLIDNTITVEEFEEFMNSEDDLEIETGEVIFPSYS